MAWTVAIALALWISAAHGVVARDSHTEGAASLNVFVSIPPQAFFVRRIAGSHADVDVLVGQGQSPHTFEPTPRQLAALAESDVYFSIGLPFEERIVEKLSRMPSAPPVVDTSKEVERIPLTGGHRHAGHGAPHTGADPGRVRVDSAHARTEGARGLADPHTWLDPDRASIQAKSICEKLVELDPERSGVFRENLAGLRADLEALDRELAEAFAPLRGEKIYVFHAAFGYLADAYGLTQVAVQSGGGEPGPRELAALIEAASEEGVRAIFVQPQFSRRSAEILASEVGAAVVPIDPLAEDYMQNLRSIVEAVVSEQAVSGGESGKN